MDAPGESRQYFANLGCFALVSGFFSALAYVYCLTVFALSNAFKSDSADQNQP